MTTQTVSKRRSRRKTYEDPAVALQRIQSMQFSGNDVLVIQAFADAGIDPEQIDPRNNVLTFNAWKALNRRVAKGAISVRVTVWIPVGEKADDGKTEDADKPKRTGMRPTMARLFHVSQTVPKDAEKGTRPDAWQNTALVREGTFEPEESAACTCPMAGVVTNVACPIHGEAATA